MSESTNIKKRSEAIRKNTNSLKKLDEENKCQCPHRSKEGAYSLVVNRNGDKHYTHVCTQCNKPVHINKYTEEETNKALKIVDDMCDLVKMMTKPSNEADDKLFRRMAKTQMTVRGTLPAAYKACLSTSANANKKNKGSSATSVMTAPNRG